MSHIINLQQNKSHNDSPVASASSQPPAVIASLERSEKRSNPLVWLPLALSGLRRRSAPRNDQSGWLRRFFQSKRNILAGFIVAIIVIILSFVLFRNSEQVKAQWFNDSWHYRMQFDVFNASTTEALVDFQVEIPTSTLTLSTLYSNSKVKSNFNDLRFTDMNGNLLDYWFPDATSTMQSVYVKFPNLPKNATSTMFMYYGNNSADDDRNGPNVFPDFFEDFSDGNYTTGPKSWSVTSGAYSVTGSDKYLTPSDGGIIGTPSIKAYGTWEFSYYKASAAISDIVLIASSLNTGNPYTNNTYWLRYSAAGAITLIEHTNNLITTADSYIANSVWYRFKVTRSAAGVFNLYIKGGIYGTSVWTTVGTATDATYTTSNYFVNQLASNHRIDNILWRKFAQTEPNVRLTAGASEEIGGGPVGYWKFDEGYGTTAYDSSSNKNNGTLTSMTTTGTSTAWVTGKIGKALKFDGVNDYVDLNAKLLSTTDGSLDATVFAWIKTSAGGEIISSYSGGDTYRHMFKIASGYLTYTKDGIGTLTGTTNLNDNQWHHVGWVKESQNVTIYVDGFEEGNMADTSPFPNRDWLIGRQTAPWENFFKGLIDEPKIYNYALTASQILTEYNQNKSVILSQTPEQVQNSQEGLVGFWKMDESTTAWDGAGDRVNDYSGNNNYGTSVNSAHATTTAKYGNAGEFNYATSDYVTISNSLVSLTSDFTLEMWIKPKNQANNPRWFSLLDGSNNLEVGHMAADQVYFRLNGSTVMTAETLTYGNWYHIVWLYKNGTRYVYLNGEAKATASGGITADATFSAIGGGYSASSYTTDGLIDDVKLYRNARTPDQIMQDYLEGPGPVAYYDFEEGQGTSLLDKSGQGNNSSSFGGGLGSSDDWVLGKKGWALDFDGTDDYASITGTNLMPSYITLEAWVNVVSSAGPSEKWLMAMPYTGNPFESYGFRWFASGSGYTLMFDTSLGSVAPTTVLAFNKMYHFVGTFDGSTLQMYINGILAGSGNVSGVLTYSGNFPFIIGSRSTSGYNTNIIADEVKIYNYALTPWQIAQEYNGGKPIAYWDFEDGNGTTAKDISGNGYNGTLINMSTTGTSTAWVTGKVGKALQFDGNNDVVSVSAITFTVDKPWSFSFWHKVPSTNDGSWEALIGGYLGAAGDGGWFGYHNSGRFWWYQDYINPTTYSWSSNFYLGKQVPYDKWTHLTVVNEPVSSTVSKVTAYINAGEYVSSGNITWSSNALTNGFQIVGIAGYGESGRYFKGLMDEVKVYNYALAPYQIKKDYNDSKAVVMGTSDSGQAIQQGLVAWYKMDEATTTWDGAGDRVNDYSGNNNAGTSFGNAHATTTAKYGNAGEFNEDADYIDATLTGVTIKNYSVSFWMYNLDTNQLMLRLGGTSFYASYASQFRVVDSALSANTAAGFFGTSIATDYVNKWTHVMFTRNSANNINVYINGDWKATASSNGDSAVNPALRIGNIFPDRNFKGLIDDVKIYNTARTADQIMQDYLQGPSPIAYYDFEEGQGTTANDKSGQGHNGTITAGNGSYQLGKKGWAYDFDGANTKIDTGSDWIGAQGYITQAISISAWIYLDSYGEANPRIISNGKCEFFINASQKNLYLTSKAPAYAYTSNNTILTGNWYHVAVTRTSTGLATFYINGIQSVTTNQNSGTPAVGSTNVIVGADNSQTATFDGKIDDLKVYNYVLTPWQIAQEYNGGQPIGHWQLDEGEGGTIKDTSGNGYNGTLSLNGSPATSTAWQTSTNCKINGCLDFDGTDDYVNVSDAPFDFTSDFSISTWVKGDNANGVLQSFACKAETGAYCLEVSGSVANKLDFAVRDATAYRYAVANNIMSNNTWYHVVGLVKGTAVQLYVNGVLQGTQGTLTSAVSTTNVNFIIGGNPSPTIPNYYFNGKIDDVRVYNYALSPTQIHEVYNAGFGTYFK